MTINERIEVERHLNKTFGEAHRISVVMGLRSLSEKIQEEWSFVYNRLMHTYKDIDKSLFIND